MGGAVLPPVAGPTAAATPAATPSPPAVATEVTVRALPERLQELSRAVVLTGAVAGETPEGLTRVRTQAGEILLETPNPLPADKPVTLQITPGQTSAQNAKVLLLLQATTPAPFPTGAAGPGTAAPQGGAGAAPAVILPNPTVPSATPTAAAGAPVAQPLPLLLPGTIVPALVIAAAPKAPAPRGAVPTLPGQSSPPPPAAPPAGPTSSAPNTTAPTPSPTSAPPGAPAAPITSLPLPTGAAPPTPTLANPAAGTPLPAGKPMLDSPVQLGGDAAHPGAEAPAASAPTGQPSVPAPEPDLRQGGTVALKILTVTPPPSRSPGAQPENPYGKPADQQGAPHQEAGTPPQAAPSDALPDADPAAPNPPASPPEDAPVLRGTVAGTTPQGQPILATRKGMLALNVQASLPQGATVTAAVTDPERALRASAPPPAATGPITERDWPAMRQILSTLASVDRAAAQSLLATVMPQPNRKLTAALSFFLSAIRGGDARAWLGEEATSALERAGRGDLVRQLEREFKTLQQDAAAPLPGDWRPYTLPMLDANGPLPVRLHIHPIKDEEDDGGSKGKRGARGSRFLLDVDLSRLGPLQLDGLVQPNRFDLILRSHTALPPDLRLDLIQIFADSIRAVGYVGGLSFQSGAKCWVKLTRAGGSGGANYTA